MHGTPSSDALSYPAEWAARPYARYWVALAGVSVATILGLAVAVYLYVSGQPTTGTAVLIFAIALMGVLTLGIDGRLRIRKSDASTLRTAVDSSGRSALKIPYSAVQFSGYLVVMTAFAAMFLLGAVAAAVDASLGDGAMLVFGLLGLFFLSFPILVLSGNFTRGYVLVSADGVYQRGWTYEAYLPWSSITVVEPQQLDGPQVWAIASPHDQQWRGRQITRLWRQDRLPDHPMIRVPAKDIGTDLVLVYHLLGFYYLHAQNRAELGTDAALDRARRAAYA